MIRMTGVFRAICILVAHAVLLLLGTPGLDFLPPNYLQSERAQKSMETRHGAVKSTLAIAAADLNRMRLPIEDSIGQIQPIFRIAQSWHLYRDGPRQIHKLEIRVDGVPVYRTLDPQLTWLKPVLRNRRIRPVAESVTIKPKAGNRKGLGRLIVDQARDDFPKIRQVEIISLYGTRPGEKLRAHHRMIANAPEWDLKDLKR
jgi:hypothetical protein